MRNLILLAFFCVLSSVVAQASEDGANRKWAFQSALGYSAFEIREIGEGNQFAIRQNDVVIMVDSCANERFSLCIVSTPIIIAIPKAGIQQGDSWTYGKVAFRVKGKNFSLRIFGRTIPDVYIIDVTSTSSHTGTQVHTTEENFELIFSNVDGLVGFTKIVNGERRSQLLSADAVFLGAKTIREAIE
jgi:hypothetical protein